MCHPLTVPGRSLVYSLRDHVIVTQKHQIPTKPRTSSTGQPPVINIVNLIKVSRQRNYEGDSSVIAGGRLARGDLFTLDARFRCVKCYMANASYGRLIMIQLLAFSNT